MFDAGEVPWGEEPPFRAPVFVVTHRSRDVLERQGGTSFTFVTEGFERAIELARDAAGSKDVAVAGGGELVPTRVVEAPEVTHIRYTVTGRSKLVLDDRGASGDLVGTAQPEQRER